MAFNPQLIYPELIVTVIIIIYLCDKYLSLYKIVYFI